MITPSSSIHVVQQSQNISKFTIVVWTRTKYVYNYFKTVRKQKISHAWTKFKMNTHVDVRRTYANTMQIINWLVLPKRHVLQNTFREFIGQKHLLIKANICLVLIRVLVWDILTYLSFLSYIIRKFRLLIGQIFRFCDRNSQWTTANYTNCQCPIKTLSQVIQLWFTNHRIFSSCLF